VREIARQRDGAYNGACAPVGGFLLPVIQLQTFGEAACNQYYENQRACESGLRQQTEVFAVRVAAVTGIGGDDGL